MSVYEHRCGGCQICPDCGKSAWCEGDRILVVPCEHKGLCGDCNLNGCLDCRQEAELEMYRTGDYDPRADPFYNHDAPKPVNHIAVNGGYWWDGSFVPVPKDTP